MCTVAIIYFSHEGSTHRLAEAIDEGARSSPDVDCRLYRIVAADIEGGRFVTTRGLEHADRADAVIFGSPTYMGGPAAQFKAFADASSDRWEDQIWSGKLAAGFTTGSQPGGDQLATLQYLGVLAAQHGMLWAGLDLPAGRDPARWNPLGTQLGLSVHVSDGQVLAADLETARYLGARIAGLGKRLCTSE